MGYERIVKKSGIDKEILKGQNTHKEIYQPQRINPAAGRDAFKARERGWMKRQIMEEEMSRLKDNERNARGFEYNPPELSEKYRRLMEESKNQERAEMSGGELKSMVQNKEAEMRDRTPKREVPFNTRDFDPIGFTDYKKRDLRRTIKNK